MPVDNRRAAERARVEVLCAAGAADEVAARVEAAVASALEADHAQGCLLCLLAERMQLGSGLFLGLLCSADSLQGLSVRLL